MGPGGQAALVVWVWGDRQIALAWVWPADVHQSGCPIHSEWL